MKTFYAATSRRRIASTQSRRDRTAQRDTNTEPLRVEEIPTEFAELGPDCRIETVESPTDPAKTLLAIYERGNVRFAERFESNGRVFVPKERGVGMFYYVRLPKGTLPYKSVRSLFVRTSKLICACVDINPAMANLASAFIVSSWFPEKLPVAPYLALVGMPRSGKTTMLRLLEMLCRHSILVTDISSAALYQVYKQATPTLLIDETSTAADQKKLSHLLRSGSTPGSVALRRDASFSCYGPKVFAWMELPNDRALITRCIVIPMQETNRTDLNRITDACIQSAAEDLQKCLLQFSLERFSTSVRVEGIDGLHSRNRDLYEALAFPIADDKKLREGVASLLSKQEQFTREPLSVRQAAVLTVLMMAAHQTERVLSVGGVTKIANQVLADRNESIKLTPHAVGNILTSFGISRRRTNRGWLLDFDQEVRRSVHVLIKRYGMECDEGVIYNSALAGICADCSICKELHLTRRWENSTMSPCANRACGADFQIRTGRWFHIRHPKGKEAHSLEDFWLCDVCSKSYTVQWRNGGVMLLTLA